MTGAGGLDINYGSGGRAGGEPTPTGRIVISGRGGSNDMPQSPDLFAPKDGDKYEGEGLWSGQGWLSIDRCAGHTSVCSCQLKRVSLLYFCALQNESDKARRSTDINFTCFKRVQAQLFDKKLRWLCPLILATQQPCKVCSRGHLYSLNPEHGAPLRET